MEVGKFILLSFNLPFYTYVIDGLCGIPKNLVIYSNVLKNKSKGKAK